MRYPRAQKTLRILVGGLLGSSLVVTAAVAETYMTTPQDDYGVDGRCPSGWDAVHADDEDLEKFDKNDDNIVCVKDVSGRGNTGDGRNAKDNN